MYTVEFLVGYPVRCYENFSMEKKKGVAMFLIIVCHNLRHRVVAGCFQHLCHTASTGLENYLMFIVIIELLVILIHSLMKTVLVPLMAHMYLLDFLFQNKILFMEERFW
ncbi:hypothetical protein AHAS_Ahas18G0199500 [Arachis hypogaea]